MKSHSLWGYLQGIFITHQQKAEIAMSITNSLNALDTYPELL